MKDYNGKISLRQMFLIYLVLTYSPSMRIIAVYSAKYAKQAAWLAPLTGCILAIPFFIVLHFIYKKFAQKEVSFSDIIKTVFGKFFGKILIIIYIGFIFALLVAFTRFYAERIIAVIFSETDYRVLIFFILILSAYVINSGLEVIARMNEMIFYALVIIFSIIFFLIISSIDVKNLLPVSYLDAIPIGKASMSTLSILLFAIIPLFFSDRIVGKEKFLNMGIKATVFHIFALTIVVVQTVGTMGYVIIKSCPFPYLMAIKQVSLFNTIERVEAIIITMWMFSDFMVITLLTFVIFHALKSVVNISTEKYSYPLFYIVLYYSSILIARNRNEVELFWDNCIIPMTIIFGYIIPCIMLGVGKIRKVL